MRRLIIMAVFTVLAVSFAGAAEVTVEKGGYFRGAPVLSTVQLPKPAINGTYSYSDLLAARGGKVELTSDPLLVDQISRIFWAGYGVNDSSAKRRTVASFDDGYGLLLYLVTTDSVYVYVPADNTLAKIMDTDMRSKIAVAANRDNAVYVGSASIIIAGSPNKAGHKQPRQGRMFMFLEAGRVAQNIELAAMTDGLGFILTEKLDTTKITSLLRMPSGFEPICIMTVGRLTEPLTVPAPAAAPSAAVPAVQPVVQPVVPAQPVVVPQTQPEPVEAKPAVVKQKNVLIFVPNRNFPEQAYTEITGLLKSSGMKVDVTSTTLDKIRGDYRGELSADFLVRNAVAENYDAIIVIGSNLSSRSMEEDNAIEKLVARVYDAGGIVGAFGRGTEVLARSGLLEGGVKVTGDSNVRRTITQNGGNFVNDPIVVDGRIITAKDIQETAASSLETGLSGTVGFADAVIKALKPQPEAK